MERAGRAGRKKSGITSIWVSAMKCLNRVIRAAIITRDAVGVKESRTSSPITVRVKRVVRNRRQPGQHQNDDSLKHRNRRAAEAFPDNYRRP